MKNIRKVQERCKKIIEKYKPVISSILVGKNSIAIIVKEKKKTMEKDLAKGNLPFTVISRDDLVKRILEGKNEVYNLIRDLEIIYDPDSFIEPLKNLVISGKVIGTREYLIQKFISVENHFNKIEVIKMQILNNIYLSVIDISQALLIEKCNLYVNQRDVIKNIKKYFVSKDILEKEDYEFVKNIILLFKDIEHGKKKLISGKEIDPLQEKAEHYRKKVIEILEKENDSSKDNAGKK